MNIIKSKVGKEIVKISFVILVLIGITSTLNTISSYERTEQSIIVNDTLPDNKKASKVSYQKSETETITVQEALDELAEIFK